MASVAMQKPKTSDVNLTPIPNTLKILTVLTVLGLIGTLYLGLVNVGTDVEQGDVQRIFYIHMLLLQKLGSTFKLFTDSEKNIETKQLSYGKTTIKNLVTFILGSKLHFHRNVY